MPSDAVMSARLWKGTDMLLSRFSVAFIFWPIERLSFSSCSARGSADSSKPVLFFAHRRLRVLLSNRALGASASIAIESAPTIGKFAGSNGRLQPRVSQFMTVGGVPCPVRRRLPESV